MRTSYSTSTGSRSIFNFEYDLGVDGQGNPAPSSLTPPAPRQAGWTNAVPQPTWPGAIPTWDGHKNPKWQYKNGSSWVDAPAGATVSSIAATDDNTNPIVLRLLWATDTARITYAAQEGGSAAGGALTVPAKGSASEDINAVSGTPTAMTATAASGYKFDGWYNGGTLITNNATLTGYQEPHQWFVRDGNLHCSLLEVGRHCLCHRALLRAG